MSVGSSVLCSDVYKGPLCTAAGIAWRLASRFQNLNIQGPLLLVGCTGLKSQEKE